MSDQSFASAVETLIGGTLNSVLIGGGAGTPVGSVAIGTALQVFRVNAGATGLEFATVSGGVGGSTGATDNAILRADGVGGATVQNSLVTIADTGAMVVAVSSASATPAIFKAAASPISNLTEWQSSSGAVGACVTAAREFSNAMGASQSEVFGAGANTDETGGLAVGYNATATGVSLPMALGNASQATAYATHAVGYNARAIGDYAFAYGWGAYARGIASSAIGNSTHSYYDYNTCVGFGSMAVGTNEFVAGSFTAVMSNVYFGKGVEHATPVTYTINGTRGLGTNIAGASINIAGGKGTGTGAGGSVVIQVAPAGGSGSSANALVDVVTVDSTKLITLADATNIALNTTTGTKIGTSTSQKLSLWNATPIVQPTTGIGAATLVSNGGTALTDTDTFDGYTLRQIVKALREIGALA